MSQHPLEMEVLLFFADDSKHRVFIEPSFFETKNNSPIGRTNLLIHEASHFDFGGLNGALHPSRDPFGSGARDRFINGAYRFSDFVTGSQ